MASVRETDDELRVRSFGNAFAMMLVWGGGAFFFEGIFATERAVPWWVHTIAGVFGLIALLNFFVWRALPRVSIDKRLRLVVIGDQRIGWDAFSGIYRTLEIRPGPKGSKFKDYTLWLAMRDGSGAVRIAVTTSDDESLELRGRVADLMRIERLAEPETRKRV